MASIPKLVILLLCTCLHTLLAHGGDDLRTYKVLHAGALKSATVNCSQPQGAVTLSMDAHACNVTISFLALF